MRLEETAITVKSAGKVEGGGEKKELKYLDFIQVGAIYMIVSFSSLYNYAKERFGPLKPGVKTVEATVRTAIGPVCRKFCDISLELLELVDHKVDEWINELDRHLLSAAQKAPEVARGVASELQRAGLVDGAKSIAQTLCNTYEPTAKEFYLKYEPLAEQYAVSAWRLLNQLPLFPQVAQMIVPTAAYWCKKYNETAAYRAAQRGYGYTVWQNLPVVPIERIGKVFQSVPTVSSDAETLTVSTST
ncbi:stress-related protein-like [Coffea arabica]|uniref:Stress-related protein-like n=1 Tax=Coffea arabica TaxID=13443 RepID=A0ABM4X715_COFAR